MQREKELLNRVSDKGNKSPPVRWAMSAYAHVNMK